MDDSVPDAMRPRAPRNSVILRALIEAVGVSAECRVRNLSVGGVCVDNVAGLEAGRRVLVTMGTLHRIRGEVAWASETLAGLRFDAVAIDIASARQPRGTLAPAAGSIGAGWLADAEDPYRKRRR